MSFQLITHIDDVLPYIEGRTEFVVAERDDFTVINYMVAFDTTFPDFPKDPETWDAESYDAWVLGMKTASILRECRGLMFDLNGKLISRPYHKFFNMNEREETLASEFLLEDASQYVLMDKLDGSFIRPVRINGSVRLCTKMGITDQSEQAEEFLASLGEERFNDYQDFFAAYVDHFTPVFEFCSRKNQIVIDYPEDALILTGMRKNETGEYISYRTLKNIARAFKIPLVKAWHVEDIIGINAPRCPTRVMEAVRSWIGIEGVVLRYLDGRMVKIKAEDYCIKHGAKDGLLLEKNVLATFLNEKLDDVLPLLDDAFKARVEAYTSTVAMGITTAFLDAEQTVRWIQKHYDTRKEMALFIKDNIKPWSQSIIFAGLDGKDIHQAVVKKVLSFTSSQTLVDEVRPFIGNPSWS
jgi:RNA ligase